MYLRYRKFICQRHCRHLSVVQPLSAALSSVTVQAPGADTAAAILAERFALPDSRGIEVRTTCWPYTTQVVRNLPSTVC